MKLTILIFIAFAVACSGDNNANNDSSEINDSTSDAGIDENMDLESNPYSFEGKTRGGFGESCAGHDECKRTYNCSDSKCGSTLGCYLDLEEDVANLGCALTENGSEALTARECDVDKHCDSSEYGKFCVEGACYNLPPCEDDLGCPSGTKCEYYGHCKTEQ